MLDIRGKKTSGLRTRGMEKRRIESRVIEVQWMEAYATTACRINARGTYTQYIHSECL